jgi:hypothetical protein
VELTAVSQFVAGFFRLLGSEASDDALVAHGEAVDDVVYTFLTLGCREAQRTMLKQGYQGWRKRSAALVWSGTDDADGGRYSALPSDFLRTCGSKRMSALREADGDGWGQEVDAGEGEQAKGNGYYVLGGNLWLCRTASPPATLYLAYHYTHPLWSAALTTVDFPVDARSLIIAEAANVAMSENWLTGDSTMERKIEVALMRAKERARDISRSTKSPRTLRKSLRLGRRYVLAGLLLGGAARPASGVQLVAVGSAVRSLVGVVARAALPLQSPFAMVEDDGVLRGEGVVPLAVCLPGVQGAGANATHHVLCPGDRLKVVGIHAGDVSAQVVDDKTLWDGADHCLVNGAVGHHGLFLPVAASAHVHLAVPRPACDTAPYPAPTPAVDGHVLAEPFGQKVDVHSDLLLLGERTYGQFDDGRLGQPEPFGQ